MYFSLNMFLPSIGLCVVLSFDLLKRHFNEGTIGVVTNVAIVLGTTQVILVGGFVALIEKQVSGTATMS